MRKLISTILLLYTLTGCYVFQQAGPFLSQRFKAKSIDKILNREDTDQETREFLERVKDIKRYAIEVLGLNKDKNYTTYVDVGKNYLATVVSATPPFSFEAHQWSYPFLGKMPYKGFYKEKDAKKEIARLKKKGFDIWSRKVSAFSSLGYFTDPLYSYMRHYSTYSLANLIIHEQTHATIFFKGHVQFNEELASFVGDTGARLYVISLYGEESREYFDIDRGDTDYQAYVKFILELKDALIKLYTGAEFAQLPVEEKKLRKARIIKWYKEYFSHNHNALFKGENYYNFYNIPVNNAYLSLYSLYHQDLSLFEDLYKQENENLPAMLERLKTLEKKKDPKQKLKEMIINMKNKEL